MPKKIFVIDDDTLALQMIASALKSEGYDVFPFSDFGMLLEEARHNPPDLVLTDVVMPDISGFDVCREIKKTFRPNPPPVIIMTGKLDAIEPILARRMGADDFVVKTSDMAVLLQAVRKILQGNESA